MIFNRCVAGFLTASIILLQLESYQGQATFQECSLSQIERKSATVLKCASRIYSKIARKIEELKNCESDDVPLFQRSLYMLAEKLNECYEDADCFSQDYVRDPNEAALLLGSLVYDEKHVKGHGNASHNNARVKREESLNSVNEKFEPDRTAAYKIAATLDCSEAALKATFCTIHLSAFPYPWLLQNTKFRDRFCSMYEEALGCVNDLLTIACPSETKSAASPKLTYAYTYYCKTTFPSLNLTSPAITNETIMVIEKPGPFENPGILKHAVCNQTFVLDGTEDMYLNLTSPGFPNGYPSNVECAVMVKNAHTTVAIFSCETFYLEKTAAGECRGSMDIQRVGRGLCGDSADYVNLQRVILGGIWAPGEELEIFRFKSGHGSKKPGGFVCSVQVKPKQVGCGEEIMVPRNKSVSLTSIPFPWFSYSVIDCHSFIKIPEGHTVSLDCPDFNAFSLPTCNQSFVQFQSGSILRVCGFGSGKFDNLVTIIDEKVEVVFHHSFWPKITSTPSKLTDPFFYECTLSTKEATIECDGEITFNEMRSHDLAIRSYGYPAPQKHFKSCTIKGKDDIASAVVVQCLIFDLGGTFNETHGNHAFIVGGKKIFFGNSLAPINARKYILSPLETSKVLTFDTLRPSQQPVKGFNCLFKYRMEMEGCSDTVKLQAGDDGKTSMDKPLLSLQVEYATNSLISCQQIVKTFSSGPVEINCPLFNIPSSPDCRAMYLQIEGKKFCGDNLPKSVVITPVDSNIFVRFRVRRTDSEIWSVLKGKKYFYNCTFDQKIQSQGEDKDDADDYMTVG